MQQRAFDSLKNEFGEPLVLAAYVPNIIKCLSIDASVYGLGAILSQIQPDGTLRLAGQSLSNTEQRCAVIEKEASGVTRNLKSLLSLLD